MCKRFRGRGSSGRDQAGVSTSRNAVSAITAPQSCYHHKSVTEGFRSGSISGISTRSGHSDEYTNLQPRPELNFVIKTMYVSRS